MHLGAQKIRIPLRTRFIAATGVAKGRVSEQAAANIYMYVHNRVKAWLWELSVEYDGGRVAF